ncbi:PrsW family intramembrane metalloprotease [Natronomonas salina]|uniref:PrsW family intramembrane metalloprotease n=1 Tax=Natronomonas salina TaxID=1710540 RepID=UPI0015B494D2|nr:PrsW family intramembrane metalloprotease [Natronomonas salina]QLD89925.1 PrsW family intramembrane metalloprotease [Natronomonas salina]
MQDPVEARADEDEDLYDVASWEPRTALDRLAVKTHRRVLKASRWLVILLGVFVLVLILAGGAGAILIEDPFVLGLIVLSIVPAGLLALYIYRSDITTKEPPQLLAATFLLAILFAGFAAVVNSIFGFLQALGLVGIVLYYYLVVGPGEEAVKLLAVRLYAYRDGRFDSVIDGAVYGAVAGLGFATIENVLYITQGLQTPSSLLAASAASYAAQFSETVEAGGQLAAVRGLAGPGHVIYSAFAGYYLGLAKFNRENAGPIVAKGLLIAAFIHATYNTLVGIVPALVALVVPGVPLLVLFFGFVVVYDSLFFYVLYRKIRRYRRTYTRVHAGPDRAVDHDSELTEFDSR